MAEGVPAEPAARRKSGLAPVLFLLVFVLFGAEQRGASSHERP